jgi:hypothetical protein
MSVKENVDKEYVLCKLPVENYTNNFHIIVIYMK